jgi:ATP-dependent DNA helicase RecQ
LENYYQEAGRCGRDGKKAYAVLLYNESDVEELTQLHVNRYPSFEVIQSVYEALVNYLQIPVHAGQDTSYTFRLDEFVRNFKLNVHQTLYALQAIESDGWIEYNEKNFVPSTLVFTTNKEGLYAFYESHPEHETLLTTLLRMYGGILDFPVFISETYIAKLLRENEKKIKEQLLKITAYGIVRYTPNNDEPRVVFLKNRVAVSDFKINMHHYNNRKQLFIERTKTMVRYLQADSCRSQFISHYFGDESAGNCGVCDNCLAKKKTDFSAEEFAAIASVIYQQLDQRSVTAEQLISALTTIKKEKAWKVLQFLQAEKKIAVNNQGILHNCN